MAAASERAPRQRAPPPGAGQGAPPGPPRRPPVPRLLVHQRVGEDVAPAAVQRRRHRHPQVAALGHLLEVLLRVEDLVPVHPLRQVRRDEGADRLGSLVPIGALFGREQGVADQGGLLYLASRNAATASARRSTCSGSRVTGTTTRVSRSSAANSFRRATPSATPPQMDALGGSKMSRP